MNVLTRKSYGGELTGINSRCSSPVNVTGERGRFQINSTATDGLTFGLVCGARRIIEAFCMNSFSLLAYMTCEVISSSYSRVLGGSIYLSNPKL